jgi:hypothetical protein
MSKHLAGNDIRDSQENTSGNNVLIKKLGNRLVWFNNLILQKVYRHTHKQFIHVLLSRSKKMPCWPTSHKDKVWYLRLSTNHRSYIWCFLTNSFSLMTIIFLFYLKFNWEIKALKSILRIMSFSDNGMWKSNT